MTKLKGLVAAAVLAAALPAQAAVDLGNTDNGSMLLTVVDFGSNVSATFDLGLNYNDFAGGVNTTDQSWDLTSGDYAAAWTSFTGSANLANVQWFVAGTDNLGAGAGARGLVATSTGTTSSVSTAPFLTTLGQFDSFMTGLNLADNHSTVANGASVATAAPAEAARLFESGKLNNVGSVVSGAIGDSLQVLQATNGANSLLPASQTVFTNGYTFTLANNGSLTYAVPEADTYAMMLAGLGLMGFIARRRTKA